MLILSPKFLIGDFLLLLIFLSPKTFNSPCWRYTQPNIPSSEKNRVPEDLHCGSTPTLSLLRNAVLAEKNEYFFSVIASEYREKSWIEEGEKWRIHYCKE